MSMPNNGTIHLQSVEPLKAYETASSELSAARSRLVSEDV